MFTNNGALLPDGIKVFQRKRHAYAAGNGPVNE